MVGDGGARAGRAKIRTIVGDFTTSLEIPLLDGVVIANALHFVPYADQARALRHVAALVSPGGPLVVVEYERRNANQWVPFPITSVALAERAREAGLGPPTLLGTQPSRYSGTIYSVLVRRP
jgi:SAM-dependent methyltransferase